VILYLDTSALVPLLIEEPPSRICGELWDAADSVTSVRLTYIEAAAALAMAERMGRISAEDEAAGRAVLDELWTSVDVVEVDHDLMTAAARVARTQALRGYDATHCAAGIALDDPEVVAASGDGRLIAVWRSAGLAVHDTNR
jgi:predicted nucleic acid-binding protein